MSYREQLKAQFELHYDAEAWVRRAVQNSRPPRGKEARWVSVGRTFGCGSGYAHEFCRRFGLDPDEEVKVLMETLS